MTDMERCCLQDEIRRNIASGARRLVADYGARLYAVALELCGNAADAEDLAFRTLERAIERIDQCDPAREIFPWLCGILVNFRKMNLRKKGANALVLQENLPEVEHESPLPDEALIRKQDAAVVEAAVRTLPEEFRSVVVLRYYEGLPLEAIATALDIPVGTVKSRLHSAKRLLREKLARTFSDYSA